jgi:cobalt-precorrin 5A hydrolase / precorrin-3B C17-methyltransferase
MIPAVVVLGGSDDTLARQIAGAIGGRLERFDHPRAELPRLFEAGRPIVGICAAGILIRLLASHLRDKQTEPPVIAISSDGAHIVPLLGGHHGANRLARQIADAIGGTAALTTASDSHFSRSLDDPPAGIVLESSERAKAAIAAALRGEPVAAAGETSWLAEAGYVTSGGPDPLVYHARNLVAGVGCERGTDAAEVIGLIERSLGEAALSPLALAAIATIDLKADEPALHAAAAHFNIPLRLFTPEELRVEPVPNPSPVVAAETGTPSVSEAAAMKAGPLIVEKRKSARATCAISRAASPVDPATLGRAPGALHLVGIGPGEAPSRTAGAIAALDAATDWVGYGLYLDLIADLRLGQTEHRFDLGDEEPRVRHALELAATGCTVSLVCSGDAQIYAMAALAYELLDAEGIRAVSPGARRVAVEVHPGISAFQAASARAGALIGHDFCCISLSDLLTPRDAILTRLDAAARADFVTALYNPRSRRRTDLLDAARTVLARHRPTETPVIVASNVGRPDERLTVTTLAEFDPTTVDMLTIILVGASTSRAFPRGDGRTVAYTPRGYDRKQPLSASPSADDGTANSERD